MSTNQDDTRICRTIRRTRNYAQMIGISQNQQIQATERKKRRIDWLCAALSTPYEKEGVILYKPSLSPKHELKKVPSCQYCGAKRFEYEPSSFCCRKGKVKLVTPQIPNELYNLLTSQTVEALSFQKQIRAYNSILAFTSFGVHLDKEYASSRNGTYTFRAQGQIYHDLPSLIPEPNNPRYFQLYFYDTDHELENRMRILQEGNLNAEIVQTLMNILEGNPYAQVLKRLKDFPSLEELKIHIAANANLDQRVYNKPSADQVAAIWVEGNNPNVPFERDIVVHAHSGTRHRIKHYFGCYDPLQYPLLFPKGEVGWHQNIKKSIREEEEANAIIQHAPSFNSAEQILEGEHEGVSAEKQENVSCREYYCYFFQIREGSNILLMKRLFQQFAVDMYIKLETTRLDYFKNKQSKIRSELYQGIVDSVTAGEVRGKEVGRRIILPASFVGGPRDMRRRYLDAMALVQRFGKPDLFITMTCNPEWKEITDELKEGQLPQDRPDLICRVFRAKLQDLKDQLFKKEIFGKVAAHVHVVEFQKRGLPHVHILIILQEGYKINSQEQFDKFVSAEIPDKNQYPELYELVTKHMIHGPCGRFGNRTSCIIKDNCKFHYPRAFSPETIQGNDGYPIYKRRDQNTIQINGKIVDNRWVVPYNPYLLTRYHCHINVEICSGVKAVKYLYKYIYKGHDKAAVFIAQDKGENIVDELRQFQDARWVSPQEGLWRIFEFELNEISPAVINLQLHLPNKQVVCYWENQNLQNVLSWDHTSRTMLTEFFATCAVDSKARQYLYKEFPEYYVWNKQAQQWRERRSREVIGRINSANPKEGERFYLRLLLNHVRGPTSFQDLLTVDGTSYLSFKEAAEKRGLLESDESISECLNEASTYQMPHTLRKLFAVILKHCEPGNVRRLWDTYFDVISEDYQRLHGNDISTIISKTLKSLNYFLEGMGESIKSYDLPSLDMEEDEVHICKEILDETSVQTPLEDKEISTRLNAEQDKAFKIILDKINSGKSGAFFIDGPGGSGKTFLYRALLANVRSRGMIAIATATSGVAAAIMPGGRTAHSRFVLPLNPTDTTLCGFSKQDGTAELLIKAHLIIWDEAPMAKRFAMETLDRSLKDIMNSSEAFGGKVIVFGGDFRQVLPVVPRGTRGEIVNASLVKSHLWSKMEKLSLTKNMRARTDDGFSKFLLRVGDGVEPIIHDDQILLPKEIVIKYENSLSYSNLINSIFPSLGENASSTQYMMNRAILATKNEYVDELNEEMIKMFPGERRIYYSFDKAEDENNNFIEEEFLNTLTPNGLPAYKLELKVNCPIMLLRNLNPSIGLCNGTRMVCRGFENNVIHAEITVGQYAGEQVLLPRIPLKTAEDDKYPFQFTRKQFPIRLCFAMTVNKAQGQTIPNVGLYLPENVFSHGQLYVALSRGISMAATKVLVKTKDSENHEKTYTKNIVYKEVLLA